MSHGIIRSRRDFLATVAGSIGAGAVLPHSVLAHPKTHMRTARTIQDVIDIILKAIPVGPIEDTIDNFKSGDPSQEVTGIVTTFLATLQVMQRTKELGANLVITHEPIYYNHADMVDQLQRDPVYEAKRRFLEESGIVVWRFHDYWHEWRPDPIIFGLVKRLGWEKRRVHPEDNRLYDIPEITFEEMCALCKEKLGIGNLRVVGHPKMVCTRVGVFAGWGGAMGEPCCGNVLMEQVSLLSQHNADVILCGESTEWTTCEYARDAVAAGISKGLIILGHAYSEEPGMEDLVDWLSPRLPGVKITHVPAGDPFRWI